MSDFISQLVRDHTGLFRGFRLGSFILSIQASRTHYCEPQMDLDDPRGYAQFEVWIGEYGTDKKRLPLDLMTDSRFADISMMFPRWSKREGLLPYAPADAVQALFEKCESMAGLSE